MYHISPQGWITYHPLIIQPVRTRQRRFTLTKKISVPQPLTDITTTQIENVTLNTVKGIGIYQKSRTRSEPLRGAIWNPTFQEHPITEEVISSAVRNGKAISGSDGSLKNSWVIAALITEGEQYGRNRIKTSSNVTGNPRNQDAHRSKLTGILHVVSMV